jgi:mannose-6-phosphate isomerase
MTLNLPVDQPLRCQPYLRPMAWGGRALARFLGKDLPPGVAVGESWELSDHPHHISVVASVTHYGHTLRQLMTHQRDDLLGPAAQHERFPWLIKLLDIHDRISVQVHPDTDRVHALLPGEGAKTEAWLVLDARPTSRIYAGLRPGIGLAELREALTRGTVVDCLHSFTPQRGDFLYLPAGTVHAAGGGVLLAEIQQTSDATFRLYDWDRRDAAGRPRELHVEQGLAAIDWGGGPRDPVPVQGTQSGLVHCPHFQVDYVRWQTSTAIGGGVLRALIVVEGQGRLANGEFVMAGDTWILPARMAPMLLHPEGTLAGLVCSLP